MTLQQDTRRMLKEAKWSVKRLAEEAQVNPSALSRFLGREGQSIAEKIYPFIAGDKCPLNLRPDLPTPAIGQAELPELSRSDAEKSS